MGRIAQDAKKLLLGDDGSDKEPIDFKTELEKAIKDGIISKAEGTLLITSRANCDKMAEFIARSDEKEITKAVKENGIEFNTPEEAKEYYEKSEKKEEKVKKDRERNIKKVQEMSLEQQIMASQNEARAKMAAEKNLGKSNEIGKNK